MMLCRICKKEEATVRIYGYPLCDECRDLVEASIMSMLVGFVKRALDKATEKMEGDEGDNDSPGEGLNPKGAAPPRKDRRSTSPVKR